MRILWATKKNEPEWKEQLITEQEGNIEKASKWAIKNGFDRLRVSDIDLTTKPDFKEGLRNEKNKICSKRGQVV